MEERKGIVVEVLTPPIESPTSEDEELDDWDTDYCHLLVGHKLLCGKEPTGHLFVHIEDRSDRNGCCRACGQERCPKCLEFLT